MATVATRERLVETSDRRAERLYAWCGPAMLVLFLVGILVAGWLPPPSPGQSAAQVAHDYRTHATAIRLGLLITTFGAALLGPWAAEIAAQVRRMGRAHRTAAYCQLALGALFVIEFILPVLVLEAAAFRPNRSPDIILALSDLGWIMLVGAVSTAVVELVLMGVTILRDNGASGIFPRWAGWFSLGVGVVFSFGGLVVFFHSGPFAWNGILAFWVPLGVFGAWVVVMTALLLRAIDLDVAVEPV
jgi:hypothetical protein